MRHGLVSLFDSMTCRKAILSNSMGNQAFYFKLTGQQCANIYSFFVILGIVALVLLLDGITRVDDSETK
jgi:hypothetical protein